MLLKYANEGGNKCVFSLATHSFDHYNETSYFPFLRHTAIFMMTLTLKQ